MTPAVAVLLLAGWSGSGLAQTVVIDPVQEANIRKYVKQNPLPSISVPRLELSVGSTLPEQVELHTTGSPNVKYRYAVVDNRTVVVAPATRRVIKILD